MKKLRNKIFLYMSWILAMNLFLLCQSCASDPAKTYRQKSIVTVYGNTIKYKPSPLILGSNIQWEHMGDGLYDSSSNTINADVLPLIKSLGITALRYPGGTLADMFNWRASIGPISARGYSLTFGRTNENIYFGIDEFMGLCEKFNLEPIFTINFNISPSDAAELVEYLNGNSSTPMGALRAQNGHVLPYNIKFFEVGNELYSYIEPGHCTVEVYAEKFMEFRNAIKNVDPNAQLGAGCEISFQKAPWAPSAIPDLLAWNKKLADFVGKDNIDFLSCHFYGPFDDTTDQDKLITTIFAMPQLFAQTIADLKQIFPGVSIAVTEYNVWFGDASLLNHKPANFDSALYDVLMLKQFVENNILLSNHWSLIGNSVFGMIEDASSLKLRPTYKLFNIFTQNFTPAVLNVDVSVPVYSISGFGSVPPMQNIPTLEVIAFKLYDSGDVSMIIINKDIKNKALVSLLFKNFQGNVTVKGGWSYTGSSDGRDVITAPLSDNTVVNNIMSLNLPAKSMTLLQLQVTPNYQRKGE